MIRSHDGPITGTVRHSWQLHLPILHLPFPPTPTPEPTPTPRPILPDFEVLPNHSIVDVSPSAVRVFGEVLNKSNKHLSYFHVVGRLFDYNGNQVATGSGYNIVGILPAGEKTCFDFTIWPISGEWSSYQLGVDAIGEYRDLLPDLRTQNHSGFYDQSSGNYEITGEIRNYVGRPMSLTSVTATLYNAEGRVIGCWADVDDEELPGYFTRAFKIVFSGRDYSDVASYRLHPSGFFRE